MPEATVAVYRGDFTFDRGALDAVVLARWPDRRYVEVLTGRLAETIAGEYQIMADDGTPLIVDVTRKATALYLSSSNSAIAAAFIAVVTTLPGFPPDGSVILAEWIDDSDIVPLQPGTTAEELLARIE